MVIVVEMVIVVVMTVIKNIPGTAELPPCLPGTAKSVSATDIETQTPDC